MSFRSARNRGVAGIVVPIDHDLYHHLAPRCCPPCLGDERNLGWGYTKMRDALRTGLKIEIGRTTAADILAAAYFPMYSISSSRACGQSRVPRAGWGLV